MPGGLVVGDAIDSLTASGTEVVVDFTRLDAARETLAYCAEAGIHAVVGTTGFTEADLEELGRDSPVPRPVHRTASWPRTSPSAPCS